MNEPTVAGAATYRASITIVPWPESLDGTSARITLSDGSVLPVTRLGNDGLLVLPGHTGAALQRGRWIRGGDGIPTRFAASYDGDQAVTITYSRGLVGTYAWGGEAPRPYFHPLRTRRGHPLTRNFPMEPDTPAGEDDHPHHRSVWVAHGDVNGSDNWSDTPTSARTVRTSVLATASGPSCCGFRAHSEWVTAEGNPLLRETTTVTFADPGTGPTMLDVSIDLAASSGPVVFGDTKEGGLLAVRVRPTMQADRGGAIRTSARARGESEAWGRRAAWCAYCGQSDGAAVCIAVVNARGSYGYPTPWHVRDYGLMAANPFGLAAFTAGAESGTYTLASGSTLSARYRLLLFDGELDEEACDAHAELLAAHRIHLEDPA